MNHKCEPSRNKHFHSFNHILYIYIWTVKCCVERIRNPQILCYYNKSRSNVLLANLFFSFITQSIFYYKTKYLYETYYFMFTFYNNTVFLLCYILDYYCFYNYAATSNILFSFFNIFFILYLAYMFYMRFI